MAASGVVVPQPLPWHRRLVGFFVAGLLRLCMKTWRFKWQDVGGYAEIKGPVIFCVWHNRLPATLSSHDHFFDGCWPGEGMAAMISASRDGGLLANIVERFDVQPIRGSTSRRGPQALLEATTWIERGYNIAITPDGPRGPVYQIQDGIIHLAQITGRPIVPTSNHTYWKICLRSWDRFQIPLPFARADCFCGQPVWVPREASESEREEIRAKLQASMLALTKD